MSEANSTFSLRLLETWHFEALRTLAHLRGMSMAELAREWVLEGLNRALDDPDDIARRIEEEKARLLAAAADMRRARSA